MKNLENVSKINLKPSLVFNEENEEIFLQRKKLEKLTSQEIVESTIIVLDFYGDLDDSFRLSDRLARTINDYYDCQSF
jgi:hypothetical protein